MPHATPCNETKYGGSGKKIKPDLTKQTTSLPYRDTFFVEILPKSLDAPLKTNQDPPPEPLLLPPKAANFHSFYRLGHKGHYRSRQKPLQTCGS